MSFFKKDNKGYSDSRPNIIRYEGYQPLKDILKEEELIKDKRSNVKYKYERYNMLSNEEIKNA